MKPFTGSVGAVTTIELDSDGVDALSSDGRLVHLRSITAGDAEGMSDLHRRTLNRSIHLRFFSSSRVGDPIGMSTGVDHGTVEVAFDMDPNRDGTLATEERERAADVASMTAVLAPRSIAVIVGPGHSAPAERLLLGNILGAGFTGSVYTVGPDRRPSAPVPSASTLAQLPTAPDLAIITGPARDVIAEIRDCGLAGVKAVIVQSPAPVGSLSTQEQLRSQMLSAARQYGMRLLGPGCAGVVNTDPDVRLNATVAPTPMLIGGLGLVAQSSELGLAVLLAAASGGVGVSQFVTLGSGLDVGENDLLLRWANDPGTQVVGLLLNDLDDAKRFAAIARQVTQHTPVVAFVPLDRLVRARNAHGPHSGAVRAVLRSSGVRVVTTTQALIDTTRLLLQRPLSAATAAVEVTATAAPPGIGRRFDLDDIPSLLGGYGIPYDADNVGEAGYADETGDAEEVATIAIHAHRDPNYGPLISVGRADDIMPESEELAVIPVGGQDARDLISRTTNSPPGVDEANGP